MASPSQGLARPPPPATARLLPLGVARLALSKASILHLAWVAVGQHPPPSVVEEERVDDRLVTASARFPHGPKFGQAATVGGKHARP